MKIGIVLSGGLAKGAFQFGFLKAFWERLPHDDVAIVSASSIGVINAYGICADKMDAVEQIWRTTDFDNLPQILKECWGGHFVKNTLSDLIAPTDKLNMPFYSTLTYLPLIPVGRYYLIDGEYHKRWRKFVRASIAFPFVTGWPKFYKGLLTLDGSAFDNIPIYPLIKNHDLDLIICLHFDSRYTLKKAFKNTRTVVVEVDASLGNALKPFSFNFRNEILNRMLDSGYDYGQRIYDKIFESGYGNLDGIRQSARELHDQEFDERMRANSLDRIVTFLNFFTQLFRGKHSVRPLLKKPKVTKKEIA